MKDQDFYVFTNSMYAVSRLHTIYFVTVVFNPGCTLEQPGSLTDPSPDYLSKAFWEQRV